MEHLTTTLSCILKAILFARPHARHISLYSVRKLVLTPATRQTCVKYDQSEPNFGYINYPVVASSVIPTRDSPMIVFWVKIHQ
jgi:hypothetical protein